MNTTIDSETVKENAERAGRAPLTAFGEVVEVLVALLRDVDRAFYVRIARANPIPDPHRLKP